jgi:type II secretory pathway component GspD/PulD (secretin)
MMRASGFLTLTLAVALSGSIAYSQAAPAPAKSAAESSGTGAERPNTLPRANADFVERTLYLNNAVQQSDANEMVTALRNILRPEDKVYLVQNQNAVVMNATPEQIALAQKILSEIDRPKRTYRLTYTVTEMEGGKRLGVQHFAMVVASGQATTLKQGSRVPIATGSYSPNSTTGTQQTQFTYLDVGMNFDATLDEFANGVRLRSKVEQSSIAEEKSGVGAQDPIVRQTSLQGAAYLTPGKPLMLGSLDIPASTRHLDVEVVMEQLP